jgi:hypothetical protein
METFREDLLYFNVAELRECLIKLKLNKNGTKLDFINRIADCVLGVENVVHKPHIFDKEYIKKLNTKLELDGYMVPGIYKNDLKNRLFFKNIIGKNFHFTVSGIDWLKTNWSAGYIPKYKEFIDFWKNDYKKCKVLKHDPKKEWAYICFSREYIEKYPGTSKSEINEAWKDERCLRFKRATDFVNEFLKQA